MPDSNQPSAPVAPAISWNPDLIFSVLADPARRKVLLALARGGPKAGAVLKTSAGRRLDATLKHLAAMRSAGLVVVLPNPEDGRRQLYGLAPSVPLVKTEAGNVIDFGFCLLRL
jgi:DNA-binding transcriptional ArsR family regulator